MITILHQPKLYDFAGNGLPFQLQGEKVIAESGSGGELVVEKAVPANMVADGEFFRFLNFDTGNYFDLIARTTPTEDYEFQATTSMADIVTAINNMPIFSQYYTALCVDVINIVINTNISQTTNWDATLDNLPEHVSLVDRIDGTAPTLVSDYSIIGKLSKLEAPVIIDLFEFSLDPDKDMITQIKLGKMFKDYIPHNLPDINNTELAENGIDKYRVQLAEKYRTVDGLETFNTITNDYFALSGKIPFAKYPDFDIIDFSGADKNYLTWINYQVFLWVNSYFLLNYFFTATSQTVHLRAKLYYTDRTDEEVNVKSIAANINNILQFPCSVEKLNLTQHSPTKTIYKYQLALVDGSDVAFTKWMTFILTEKPLYARQFLFLNGFGVWENFNTKGKRSEKLKSKRTITNKELSVNYVHTDSELISEVEESYSLFDIETGSVTKMEAENFTNMMLSNELYEIVDDEYLRCYIITGSVEIVPEDLDLFSIKFSYRYAFNKWF